MDVSYTNSEVELSYARWNSKSNAYDSNIQKSFYELNDADATLSWQALNKDRGTTESRIRRIYFSGIRFFRYWIVEIAG